MLPVEAWRIFYADGSVFSSEDGTWAEAPAFGVQAVVWYHVPREERPDIDYRTVDAGSDIYVWQGEGDEVAHKMGLWIDPDGFYRVMTLAERMVTPPP